MNRSCRCLNSVVATAHRRVEGKIPVVRLSEIGQKRMTSSPIAPVILQANDIQKKRAKHRDVGLVEVVDPSGTSYGVASYNPSAYMSCRILHRNSQARIDQDFFFDVFSRALQARIAALGGMPGLRKRAFRLINGEGDHLPGLYVDILSPTTACVNPSTAFMDRQIDLIVSALRALLPSLKEPVREPLQGIGLPGGAKVRMDPASGLSLPAHPMRSAELIRRLPTLLRLARPEATRRKVLAVHAAAAELAVSMAKLAEEGENDANDRVMVLAVEQSKQLCEALEGTIGINGIRSRIMVQHDVPRLWLRDRGDEDGSMWGRADYIAARLPAGEFDLAIVSPPPSTGSDVEALKELLTLAASQLVPGGVMVLCGVDEMRYIRFQKLLLQALAPRRSTLILFRVAIVFQVLFVCTLGLHPDEARKYDWFMRNIGGVSAVPEVLPSGDVFLGTDEGVIAVLAKDTGLLQWRTIVSPKSQVLDVHAIGKSNVGLVQTAKGQLFAVDLKNGNIIRELTTSRVINFDVCESSKKQQPLIHVGCVDGHYIFDLENAELKQPENNSIPTAVSCPRQKGKSAVVFSNEALAEATAVFVDGDALHARVSPTQIRRYMMSSGKPMPSINTTTSEEADFIMRELKFPTLTRGHEFEMLEQPKSFMKDLSLRMKKGKEVLWTREESLSKPAQVVTLTEARSGNGASVGGLMDIIPTSSAELQVLLAKAGEWFDNKVQSIGQQQQQPFSSEPAPLETAINGVVLGRQPGNERQLANLIGPHLKIGVVLSETGKLFALDLATSEILWSRMESKDCVIDRVKNGPKIWLRVSHSNGKYDFIEPTTGDNTSASVRQLSIVEDRACCVAWTDPYPSFLYGSLVERRD
ncbi:DUF1620 super [Perkinsus olseni]|uniref:DUF1620 super n=1 Tax=Perkinsus olseni TaxID=32597 RepID=A0A7J6PJH6_PEROL|nr:DUF1620 super [Perkinsus olseni]